MKRKAVATEFKYSDCMYRHHGGPVQRMERASGFLKQEVRAGRINKEIYRQQFQKKALENFNFNPRLVKRFHLGTIGESKITITVTR
jgi:hypothetical protein